jgi:acyl carrier protein
MVAVFKTVTYNNLYMDTNYILVKSHNQWRYNMVFEKIRELIVDQLGIEEDEITLNTHLMKDLEADSLDAVEIIMAIEDEFGIEVPDEDAEKFQLISDIVKYVEEKTAE